MADRQDTLDLLRRDAPQFERALQDAGLKTGDNAMQFSLRDQTAGHQGQSNRDAASTTARIVIPDSSSTATIPRNYSRLAALRGGVDIRV